VNKSIPKPKRLYVSPARKAAAAKRRVRVVAVATRLLGKDTGEVVSLEAVAKAARVTRLTVYNQFGSRRGLLEAVFDERARVGGLGRIAEAMSSADPREGLNRLVDIFCQFWNSDPALGRLHAAASIDPEFAQALEERNERRRKAVGVLVKRLVQQGTVPERAATDLTDLLFALTSYPMLKLLSVNGRSPTDICHTIKDCCADAVERARASAEQPA
jgi:AcrR family transcriptional regulator